MKKKGFTLIELLVVIAIIALLLSIVMPALKKAKGMARFLICKSSLRQLSVSINSYTTENKGRFVPYYGWTGTSLSNALWIDAIGRYCSNIDQARYCPEAKETNPDKTITQGSNIYAWSWNTGTTTSTDGRSKGSYYFNGYLYTTMGISATDKQNLITYAGGDEKNLFSTLSSVSVPSTIPVLVDGNWPDGWVRPGEMPVAFGRTSGSGNWTDGIVNPSGTQNYISRMLVDRHGKRLGVGFLDGHAEGVEIVKDLELWNLRWRPNWKQPSIAERASIDVRLSQWQK